MHAGYISRYSLLAVVGAGFFVSAPIATWLVVDSMTAPAESDAMLALDVPERALELVPVALDEPALDVDTAAINMYALAQEARIVPAFQNGRTIGFKVFSIRPESEFARAGLQNGDVITRINGIELSSFDRALEASQRVRDGLIVVNFVRNRERGTLTHHIPSSTLSVPSIPSIASPPLDP